MGVTRLGDVTGLDRIGIPVAIAIRPNSRSVSVSQGKGLSAAHAKASALMEAAELFHAEDLAARTRRASFRELSREACAIGPELFCRTGRALPSETDIPWVEGYDLLQREPCWVPWEIVHTDYTLSSEHSGECFLSGTNGLASGNHIVEAFSSGICELVERDAVALWTAKDVRAQASCRVDLLSTDDEDCRDLLARYEAAGIPVRLWDVTSDIGIAAFVCDILAIDGDASAGLRRYRGAGCHPSRAVALSRALTEAAQVRLTYIAGIRDDIPPSDYRESPREKLGGALLDAVSEAAEPRLFNDIPDFDADDLAIDLSWELERLQLTGVERVIAVDLTRADLGIPVVRMIIPGLEWKCDHPDYTPGPRALRLSAPTA